MTQEYYSTGRRKFQHITKEKRAQLEILLKIKPILPKVKIALMLEISRSTLYEELERGSVEQLDTNLVKHKVYFADVGQRVYEENRKNSRNPTKLVKVSEFIEYAEQQILEEELSPDAVVGEAKKYNMFGDDIVCTKTLYNYIDNGYLKVKNIDLPLRVKLNTKVLKDRKNRRIMGESIENRPEEVDKRLTFGHWEIDTIVGTVDTAPVLLTLDERKTRKRIIKKIDSRSCVAVNKALGEIMDEYGNLAPKLFKTITSDNGSEFTHLGEAVPFAKIYYTHPYSSCERGTNENQNGLVRRFFPKGKSFEKVTDEAVKRVQDWINFLPRKIFDYSCSHDLFLENFNFL
jgi:IS30 family transposase